jgi:protein SCO1/2
MSPIARTVTMCLVFVAVVLGMLYHSITRMPVLTEDELRERGVFILPTPRELAAFELTDHRDERFDAGSLRGHWNFLFFGFTHCPDICPTAMATLAEAERQLQASGMVADAPFRGLLVSVDPERDDAETLGRYVNGFSENFLGVRGDLDALVELTTQLNVAFAKVPDGSGTGYQVDHSANIVIVNPYGHYHGFIRMPHKAETVAATYRSLSAGF